MKSEARLALSMVLFKLKLERGHKLEKIQQQLPYSLLKSSLIVYSAHAMEQGHAHHELLMFSTAQDKQSSISLI